MSVISKWVNSLTSRAAVFKIVDIGANPILPELGQIA